MAANYKVLQWNERPDWTMTKEFMLNYKIDMLRIFPGEVEEKLIHVRDMKGVAKAKKAYSILAAAGRKADKLTRTMAKQAAEGDEAGQQISETFEDMPEFVPTPKEILILENTNLYEALKYVSPGHFLVPSETIPVKISTLPNGRIPSFDIISVKPAKLTIVNIARFPFLPNNPKEHIVHCLETIWTHFLKNDQVTCQLSFRPKKADKGLDLEWMWKNCVHLRPEVVQRALPSTSRLALGPLTNGNEITWLVVNRNNQVDYRERWRARQLEQTRLLKAGRGMLPLEERKRVKRELKLQLKSGKAKKDSILTVSPMAMSVARLGIQRQIDHILFKYEKLFGNIRYYLGTRYGAGRFLDRHERDVVNKAVRMQLVDLLKYTPEPYIANRNSRMAQLEAATGESYPNGKRRRRVVEQQPDFVEPEKYEERLDPCREVDLQASDSAQLAAVAKDLGYTLSSKAGFGKANVFKSDLKREQRERAFVERIVSAKLEDEQEDRKKSEDKRDLHKEHPTTMKHHEEGIDITYEKKGREVTAEDEIEALKKEAQNSWEEDDPLNTLSGFKTNSALERPQNEGDPLLETHSPASATVTGPQTSAALERSSDSSERETNRRAGLLPYMSKFEVADRVELPIRKHNSDKAPSPIRADDQISKSKSTKYHSSTSGHKVKSSELQSNHRMAITPRSEYGLLEREYRRGARDNIASELPRESQNDRYGGQRSDMPFKFSSGGVKHHNDSSDSQNSEIEPFQLIRGIGSDVILEKQYKTQAKRPVSDVKSRGRKKSKGAPIKKRQKQVVDDFADNQKGRAKSSGTGNHRLLRAFKMDFRVAGDK
ncbi:hypothetical protein E6O75_ATG04188 [Venturia nashicola]|uniref:Uncharacterized protein n=1 Tax=Venturia nashicola TaxID=86259 RepID=A0A4Z1P751_9PEZI|nr:hypothetical protein E6O75_ATG04188 [Venturia nashicola]